MEFKETIGNLKPRAGKQHRLNSDRFFNVMSQGWYIHTREGICGPFLRRDEADAFLSEHLGEKQSTDPSESWRLD